MDEPEIDVLRVESREARGERLPCATGTVRRELGRDEHVLPGDAALADGSADLLLVAIHAGRVQVPVADIERALHDRLPGSAPQRPRPEADERHARAVAYRHRLREHRHVTSPLRAPRHPRTTSVDPVPKGARTRHRPGLEQGPRWSDEGPPPGAVQVAYQRSLEMPPRPPARSPHARDLRSGPAVVRRLRDQTSLP